MIGPRRGALLAMSLAAACRPGRASEGGDASTDTGDASTDTGEDVPAPAFPDLPEDQPSCAERGGQIQIIGAPHIVVADDPGPSPMIPGDLEPTQFGLLALWRSGYPDELAYAARLDPNAELLAEPFELFERPIHDGPRAAPLGSGFVVNYCGVWPDGDFMTTLAIDQAGAPTGPERVRSPIERPCDPVTNLDEGAWTGARHLLAWATTWGHELQLDGFGVDTISLATATLGSSRAYSQLTVGEQAALLVGAADSFAFTLHRLDSLGNPLAGGPKQLERPFWGAAEVVVLPIPGGFAAWMFGMGQPMLHWRLDAQGTTLAGPTEVEYPPQYWYLFGPRAVRRPGGFAVATTVVPDGPENQSVAVLLFDNLGELVEFVPIIDDDGHKRYPVAAQRGDSTFVMYLHDRYAGDDDLQIVELACVP